MKKAVSILILLLIVALFAGCGGSDTKTINTDKGSVSVNEKENKVEVKTDDGNKSQISVGQNGEGVELPSDYPKDLVPIVDGAKINMANRNENAGKITYWVAYFTDKTPKEVNSFYQDALKALTEPQKAEMNGSYNISGTKDGKIIGVIITTEENDGKKQTLVNITITPKP